MSGAFEGKQVTFSTQKSGVGFDEYSHIEKAFSKLQRDLSNVFWFGDSALSVSMPKVRLIIFGIFFSFDRFFTRSSFIQKRYITSAKRPRNIDCEFTVF